MILDALTLGIIADEFNTLLAGGKINKVSQPAADTIILNVYAGRCEYRLVLAASPSEPRLYISAAEYKNPITAPSFCMHLRKHISGAEINRIAVTEGERIVKFELTTHSEFSSGKKTLIYEIMGRYSNIFLTGENGIISDCLKKIPADMSEAARNLLPGLPYIEPPKPPEVLDGICGISRTAAGELTARSRKSGNSPRHELENLRREFSPTVYLTDGVPTEFTFTPYGTISGDRLTFASMRETMQYFYSAAGDARERAAKTAALRAAVGRERAKLERTQKTLSARLADSAEAENNRLLGELITANIYKIKPRDEIVEVVNYFDEKGGTITIRLDKALSPAQNAQRYYKKYTKQKKTYAKTHEQLESVDDRKTYLDSISYSIDTADTLTGLNEIEAELIEAGLLPAPKTALKKKEQRPPSCEMVEFEGYTIYAGKNNVQNEYVTFSLADENDIWLHIQGAAGSHVVLKRNSKNELPDKVLLFAAEYAAQHSSKRGSGKVAVDYCLKKYVKKSRNGTGRVNYWDYSTVIVES